jgi:hypothetical protein
LARLETFLFCEKINSNYRLIAKETTRIEEAVSGGGRATRDLSGPAAQHESGRAQESIAPKRDCKLTLIFDVDLR